MKSNCILIMAAAMAAAFAPLPAQAQQMSGETKVETKQGWGKAKTMEESWRRTSDILGMEVRDSQGYRAGTVKDLLIDLQNGRVAEVILDVSPPMVPTGSYPSGAAADSTEGNLTGVPPSCLSYDAIGKGLCLNFARVDLKGAPTFKLSEWRDMADNTQVAETYKRYGATAPADFGTLERARLLAGSAVINNGNQKLGKAENLVVSLPGGRVDKIIVASGGFLGINRDLTAVAPTSFTYDQELGKLRLDIAPGVLNEAPHFKAADWRLAVVVQPSAFTGGYSVSDAPEIDGAGTH